jgi:GntR family transcriptional repressor for pyruvate dehydrogenase complex
MTYDRHMAERPNRLFTTTEVQRRPRLSDQVAQLMLDAILEQRLEPGDRLPSERELGEQFGVSRTVVREAVRALVAKGVIEVISGSGLRIAEASPRTVRESLSLYLHASTLDYERMHEVRAVLEVHMAGMAAERASEDDLRVLTSAHEAMARAVDDGRSAEELAILDLEFHRAMARATHNELFLLLLDSIGEGLLEIRRHNLRLNAERTVSLHEAIRLRIQARDPEGARRAMSEHLDDTLQTWRQVHRRHAG